MSGELHEALFYKVMDGGKVKCGLCPRGCVISQGSVGFCRVRLNLDGKLYSWIYGRASSVAVDPIEKKPLFHFHPGSDIYSVGTVGCNLSCLHCQNWSISQAGMKYPYIRMYPPEQIVEEALKYGCKSIAFTYNEPTIAYEYMLDTFKLAKEEGLRTVSVTNGYISREPLLELIPYLDAANVDVKAFTDEFYMKVCGGAKLKPVLETVEIMHRRGVHVEVTYLVIPGLNDREEEFRSFASWVASIDPEMPTHFSRFFPMYRMTDRPPTPVETLKKARKTAIEQGLKHVYIGNVPGEEGETTFCPRCGKPLIRRYGFTILDYNLTEDGRCKFCERKIKIII